jgi:hypothetical protein
MEEELILLSKFSKFTFSWDPISSCLFKKHFSPSCDCVERLWTSFFLLDYSYQYKNILQCSLFWRKKPTNSTSLPTLSLLLHFPAILPGQTSWRNSLCVATLFAFVPRFKSRKIGLFLYHSLNLLVPVPEFITLFLSYSPSQKHSI